MSAYENTPGIERKINHIHNPIIPKKGVRKPRKKRVYANLMLTQQMIEAKEAEKRRINEVKPKTQLKSFIWFWIYIISPKYFINDNFL